MNPLIIALDQGTTSSRSIAFDANGSVVASSQQEFRQIFPQPGWVEHDANEIWASQRATLKNLLQKLPSVGLNTAQAAIKSIASIAITNQRETTVLWDRVTGQPLANAIVWQDRRTAAACDALRKAGKAALIQKKTGLVLDAYFSGTKLAWLLDHVLGARKRAERGELCFGTIDSWLIYKLTAGKLHVTDASNASRTLLLNIHTGQWDDELLRLFNIPRALLPKVVASSGVVGMTAASVIDAEIPIAGIAGDQQAATFGQACFAPGMAKNTYGTGCFMLMNTGTTAVPSKNKLLTTIAWHGPQGELHRAAYALEGSVFMGGATVQWLRDGLQIIEKASDIQALAQSVRDTGDVYLVPAFAGLGTPHWDGYARGTLVGMTRGTTRAHIARAALEAIALQSADVFDAMRFDSGIALRELRVDGGACSNDLLMQMQADFLGVPVVRPRVTETTALGAAYLAGLATGVWKDAGEISGQWQIDQRFEPRMKAIERQAKLARWREAVQRSKNWAQN
jgi:glycerol kinase